MTSKQIQELIELLEDLSEREGSDGWIECPYCDGLGGDMHDDDCYIKHFINLLKIEILSNLLADHMDYDQLIPPASGTGVSRIT